MRKPLALLATALAVALAGCSNDPSPGPKGGDGGIGGTAGTGGTGGDASGGSGGTPTTEAASIEISVEDCDLGCGELEVGDTLQLIATVRDADGAIVPDVSVTWTSSDPEIATVVDGLVTALQGGLVDITAEAEGISETAWFRVLQVENIRLHDDNGGWGSIAAIPGKTIRLVAQTFSGGFTPMPIYGIPVDWEIATDGVVEVIEETIHDEFPALVLRTVVPGEVTVVASVTRGDEKVEGSMQVIVLDPVAAPAQAFFDDLADPGNSGTCALADGIGYCWGDNWMGQLGTGTLSVETVPMSMAGGHTFTQISIGEIHGCGLDSAGAAYCWGANYAGQLGTGADDGNSPVPVAVTGGKVFTSIAAASHTCAIDTDGAAWCWGTNFAGELGTGDTEPSRAPAKVIGGHLFQAIVPGSTTTCALDRQGKAHCWGSHQSSLGIGNSWAGEPIGGHKSPVPVHGDRVFTDIAASMVHTCAIDAAGAAFCWGRNSTSQLGVPSAGAGEQRWEPVQVEGIPALSAIAVGNSHSCGLTRDGAVWCWGGNDMGQLGAGDQDPREGPVEVLGGLTFRQIRASGTTTCGLTVEGGAYCWGMGANGALGNGLADGARPVPVPVHAPHSETILP